MERWKKIKIQFINITHGKIHELNILKKLSLDPGTIIAFDRGFIDYSQMGKWNKQGVYWVTLLKKNADYKVVKSRMVPKNRNIINLLTN
jgi:hypothetical protein